MSLETGERLRDLALFNHEVTKPDWLTQARNFALEWLKTHDEVTTDDVRDHVPIPEGMHPSVTGAVFRDDRFKCKTWRKSRRDKARARRIGVYVLAKDLPIP